MVSMMLMASKYEVFRFISRSAGDDSKSKSFLPLEKQFLVTRNGKKFKIKYFILFFQVPAIPYETLTQLQESDENNDSTDYFQSIELDKVQFIEEVFPSSAAKKSVHSHDDEDIPDIDDFNDQNLLINNDPVLQ